MKKNGYLEKQRAERQAYIQATCDIYTQFMMDVAMITLHDEFGFGRERLKKFHAEMQKSQREWHDALGGTPESGFLQTRMDQKLAEALGEELVVPFEQRYEWLRKIL